MTSLRPASVDPPAPSVPLARMELTVTPPRRALWRGPRSAPTLRRRTSLRQLRGEVRRHRTLRRRPDGDAGRHHGRPHRPPRDGGATTARAERERGALGGGTKSESSRTRHAAGPRRRARSERRRSSGGRCLLRSALRLPRPGRGRDGLRRPQGLLRIIASSVRWPEHRPRVMVVERHHIACQTTITGTFVALVHPFTRRPAPPEWPRRRVRAHQHLPIRRPRTSRGGMGAEGHPMPTASVGR